MLARLTVFSSLLETSHLQSLEEVLGTARSALVLFSSRPALDGVASLIDFVTRRAHSRLILLCLLELFLEVIYRGSTCSALLRGGIEFFLQLLDVLFEILHLDLESWHLFSLKPSLADLAL